MFHSPLQVPARARPTGPSRAPNASPPAPGDLARLVREALERDRVRIEVQPIVMLVPAPRAASHEGFVRILDAGGRMIPASRFMDAMEGSPLGRDLDCASLRLALQALRAHPGLRLAINASARSLGNGAWRAILEGGLRDLGPRLTLELAEGSAMLLADRVTRVMEELRPSGLRFVLDDFGAGQMSLRQLRDFGFDGVKIERAVVADLDTSPANQALAEALVTVAHRFGMIAIAKGVETEGEAAHLRGLGVDGLQGFLLGRPGPLR